MKVTAKMIIDLCSYSGKDMVTCKRALTRSEGNMDAAKKIVGKKYTGECTYLLSPKKPKKAKAKKPRKVKEKVKEAEDIPPMFAAPASPLAKDVGIEQVITIQPVFQRGRKIFTIDGEVYGVLSLPATSRVAQLSVALRGNQLVSISVSEEQDDWD